MKVFLSVGATYSPDQEQFVQAFESFLVQNGCVRLTVGRGSYTAKQPVLQTRDLMQEAEAVIVLAFTRLLVVDARDKPGSKNEKRIADARYPTVWNQIEAAMAFGLKLPLLVILEEGLFQEAMLKDRLEFRVQITPLDPGYFKSEEFKGVFADFQEIAKKRAAEKKPEIETQTDSLTIGQMIKGLRPDQFWKVGTALFSLASGLAIGAFWLGMKLAEIKK
ncbi:MAG TPA: hypothetical protein VMU45_03225 [Candidatus Eisenbacteria bacterium]|nr:hypothetical protein [Candidatus Eisenbacteria bacterium]